MHNIINVKCDIINVRRDIVNVRRDIVDVTHDIINVRHHINDVTPAIFNAKRENAEVMSDNSGKTYKLLGADGKFYQSQSKGTLGGHRKDKIYGTLDCAGAKRWIARGHYVKQRVFFADEQTAIAAGFRPCARCLPEKYKEWKAKKT